MAMIEISNLNPVASNLLAVTDSFFSELKETDITQIFGGDDDGKGYYGGDDDDDDDRSYRPTHGFFPPVHPVYPISHHGGNKYYGGKHHGNKY